MHLASFIIWGLCYLIGFFCLHCIFFCFTKFTLHFILFHKIKNVIIFSFFGFFNLFFLLKKNHFPYSQFFLYKKKILTFFFLSNLFFILEGKKDSYYKTTTITSPYLSQVDICTNLLYCIKEAWEWNIR